MDYKKGDRVKVICSSFGALDGQVGTVEEVEYIGTYQDASYLVFPDDGPAGWYFSDELIDEQTPFVRHEEERHVDDETMDSIVLGHLRSYLD